MNRAADRYKLRVKRSLFCGRADRDRLLNQFAEMLDDFQQTKPEADYAEYTATFGEPAACAGELLSSLDESKKEAARKKQSLHRYGVFVGIIVVLVCMSFFWYMKYRKSTIFNGNVTIIEHTFNLTEEEYNNAKRWALESLQP